MKAATTTTKTTSPATIALALRANLANRRVAIAHTKDKSEVRGGGRKPWKQKGTGRARHGSNRSPIWVGGGITFGPRSNRNFALSINKKQKNAAIWAVLSGKQEEGQLKIIDSVPSFSGKTKEVIAFLAKNSVDRKALIVLDDAMFVSENGNALIRGVKNTPTVSVIPVRKLNVYFLLNNPVVMMSAEVLASFNQAA
ncbi:MAG: 50S ribosomal protein L4 [Patescibacteria group bacterium]